MTRDERNTHNIQLVKRVMPELLTKGTWRDFTDLTTQDTIVIYANARQMLEKKIYEADAEKEGKLEAAVVNLYRVIPEKLLTAEKLYLVIDRTTRMPYIDDNDNCYIFSEQEFATEALDYFAQEMRSWEMEPVEKKDIPEVLGQTFYEGGVRYALVDNGQTFIRIPAEDLVKPEGHDDLPDEERPIVNPDYLRALAKLVQETRWLKEYEGKQKNINRYEADVIRTFCRARFLLPGQEEEDGKIRVPSLQNENGEMAVPVFTDYRNLRKVIRDEEILAYIWTPKNLLELSGEHFVINVGTINFLMEKDTIRRMIELYEYEIEPADAVAELLAGRPYYTPFLFEGEEGLHERDDTIYYTAETVKYAKEPQENVPSSERGKMHFRKVKDEKSGKEYLALFSDIETLRKAYPAADRISLVDKTMVQSLVWETEGVAFDIQMAVGKDFLIRHGFPKPEEKEQESPL